VLIETAIQDEVVERDDVSVELTSGPSGLPEAMTVMLDAESFDAQVPSDGPRPLPTAVAVSRHLADTLRAAGLDTDVTQLRLLRVERLRPPIPSRRLDLLV